MANRQRCNTCSIANPNGAWSMTVLIGDGNCSACVQTSNTIQGLGEHDAAYTFGRPRKYMEATMNPFQISRLLILRGQIQDRRIARHITTPDEDGL